jgi:hypothetical protein
MQRFDNVPILPARIGQKQNAGLRDLASRAFAALGMLEEDTAFGFWSEASL